MSKTNVLPYLYDASNMKGSATNIFLPKTIEETKKIIRNNNHICIRGGGSGLSGGAVPAQDVILDLSKLNHIGTFDPKRKIVEVEAGVILDDLQYFLEKEGLEFPIRPSSHAVCTIGGMIATDAVGSRAGIYGRTSKWVRWIDIITPKGVVERKGATEISDFSGLEGITGVIVKACLNLTDLKKRTASLKKINTIEEVFEFVKKYRKESDVSMIELISPYVSQGIGLEKKYNIIIEYESNKGDLKGEDYDDLMDKRDNIYPFLAGNGYSRIEDPKIITDKIMLLIKWLDEKQVPYFGHISVGIIHPCFNIKDKELIKEMMILVKRIGGQISGEHGIGVIKKEFIDTQDKKIIENIKKRLDKTNKFNRGKIIDI